MKGIYKITSPVGKVYIGKSSALAKRKEDYKHLSCKGQRKLYSSLKKYGFENHSFEIIELVQNDLDKRERYHYDECVQLGYTMLNLVVPGEKGNTNHSKETKSRISKGNSKPITQFSKSGTLIKVWNSTIQASKELNVNRTAIGANLKGFTKTCKGFVFRRGIFSEDIIINIVRKKATFIKKREPCRLRRPVFQFTKEGCFIKEWHSMTIAAEELGLNYRCISAAVTGFIKQTGGFRWSKNKYI